MSKIDFTQYKMHPRVLEIRFIVLFSMFEREYGEISALKFYDTIAGAFYCDMTKITSLVNKRFDIKRFSKTKLQRWRQEVLFMGACYGDSTYKVAKDYLCMKSQNVYSRSEVYDVNKFVCDEFIRSLDEEVTLCGIPAYRTEVTRFFEIVDNLATILIKWKA